MNKQTLEALDGSIKKWDRIVKSTKAKDRGYSNCPLCHLFADKGCKGCPVKRKTGVWECYQTPLYKFRDCSKEHNEEFAFSRIPHDKDSMKYAKAERDFLISLRPKKRKAKGA